MFVRFVFHSRALSRDLITLETPSTETQVDKGPNSRYDVNLMQLEKRKEICEQSLFLHIMSISYDDDVIQTKTMVILSTGALPFEVFPMKLYTKRMEAVVVLEFIDQ